MTNSDPLNPWFSMWTKPRDTIQQIIDSDDPKNMVLFLAAISGISSILSGAVGNNTGDQQPLVGIIAGALIVGPIAGVIGLYISGMLLSWTGKWIGGRASAEYVRTALAWAHIPVIWTVLLWIPEILIFGQETFMTPDENSLVTTAPYAFYEVGFGIIKMTASVWAFILLLKGLGQVQGFSAWKALWNLMIPGLLFLIPIILIVVAVGGMAEVAEVSKL